MDLERDEILLQFFSDNNDWDLSPYLYVDTIPEDYIEQFRLGLPLSMSQMKRVIRLREAYDEARKYERTLASLTLEQRSVYESLTEKEQDVIIEKLITNTDIYNKLELDDLPADAIEGELSTFLEAGLPLLERHKEIISEKRYEQNRIIKEQSFHSDLTPHWESQQRRRRIVDHSLDVQDLLDRHMPTLKRVREKQQLLSQGLTKDWEKIQDSVRKGLKGEEIDYVSFKVNLMNICFALHVEMDEYL